MSTNMNMASENGISVHLSYQFTRGHMTKQLCPAGVLPATCARVLRTNGRKGLQFSPGAMSTIWAPAAMFVGLIGL